MNGPKVVCQAKYRLGLWARVADHRRLQTTQSALGPSKNDSATDQVIYINTILFLFWGRWRRCPGWLGG
jgi:hypothetical protein